jgi:hypothetical protein
MAWPIVLFRNLDLTGFDIINADDGNVSQYKFVKLLSFISYHHHAKMFAGIPMFIPYFWQDILLKV